jgi:hypothetical protein
MSVNAAKGLPFTAADELACRSIGRDLDELPFNPVAILYPRSHAIARLNVPLQVPTIAASAVYP